MRLHARIHFILVLLFSIYDKTKKEVEVSKPGNQPPA